MSDHDAPPEPAPRRVANAAHHPPVRAVVFTLFVESPDDWPPEHDLPPDDRVRYLVYQYEVCPTTGRMHVQGYVELTKACRFSGIKAALRLPDTVHMEKRQGTPAEARAYCMKQETRLPGTEPYEHGRFGRPAPTNNGGQQRRNALDEFAEYCARPEVIRDRAITIIVLRERFLHVYNWSPRAFQVIYDRLVRERRKLYYHSNITLRDWQRDLKHRLEQEPERRRIWWIWSEASGTGKTTFIDHLATDWDNPLLGHRVLVGAWSLPNVLYQYDEGFHTVIAFNIPRQDAEQREGARADQLATEMDRYWSTLERFSDGGAMLSTKYEAVTKYVWAHIVVTANIPPPYERLPYRFIEIRLDSGHQTWPEHPLRWQPPVHEPAAADNNAVESSSNKDDGEFSGWDDPFRGNPAWRDFY